jgi:hypothetical protein
VVPISLFFKEAESMKQQITDKQREAANPTVDKIRVEGENVKQLQTLRSHLEACMKVINEADLTYNGYPQEVSFYSRPPRTVPFDTVPGSHKTAAYATVRMQIRSEYDRAGSPYRDHDDMVSFLAFDNRLYIADSNTTKAPDCHNARIMCIYTPTRKSETVMGLDAYSSPLQPLHKGSMKEDGPLAIADSLADSLVRPFWGEEKALELKLRMINAMMPAASPSADVSAPTTVSPPPPATKDRAQLSTGGPILLGPIQR